MTFYWCLFTFWSLKTKQQHFHFELNTSREEQRREKSKVMPKFLSSYSAIKVNESWYLWSADLSKRHSQLIVSIFSINSFCQYLFFLDILFKRFNLVAKCVVTPHCLYRDSLTLKKNYIWEMYICAVKK